MEVAIPVLALGVMYIMSNKENIPSLMKKIMKI